MTNIYEDERVINVPVVDKLSLPLKYRKAVEEECEKYYQRNQKTKNFAEFNSNFLPDDLDTYLRNLSRHDFLKTLWAFLNQPKRYRQYFNRSWYLYRMFFSPSQKDKDLRKFARSIHKAFAKPINKMVDEIVDQEVTK